MAANSTYSDAIRTLMIAALIGAETNSGYLDVYDGAQPAGPDTAVTSQTKLVRFTLNATAFAAGAAGVVNAGAIADATILATGTAAWCRMLKSDGTTAIADGNVGTSAANLIFPTVSFVAAATASISSLSFTQDASGG